MSKFLSIPDHYVRRGAPAALVALGLCLSHPATAEPLELEFRPPEITPQNVCIPRASDQDTIEFWQAWDGKSFGDLTPALIKRDIKRLQHIDAAFWVDTIEQIIANLEELDPSYAGKNSLLTRIQAMQDAGQFERIRNLQLVQQLSVDAENASPRIQNALSEFYRSGIGVPQDLKRADELLVSSGYSGNADALLTLVKRSIDNDPVEGWDVPNELAVTMAFGSLIGELNTTICDRTARIAREYHSGEVVAQNSDLARDWFRFTADLGDANAAWKLVEYHIQSEGFEKDNETLLKYLKQASDAGLPFAQIELGRLYERGSLVERDLDKALFLFRKAATSGERPGLTRLGLFLEEYDDQYSDLREEKYQVFRQLAALPDAPGWVFTRLAQNAWNTDGRWGGLDEAIAFLERAEELGDIDGTGRLAHAILMKSPDAHTFEKAVNLLSGVVSGNGGVTQSKQLHSAFMCRAQSSPRLSEAAHWFKIEDATDTANVDLSALDLVRQVDEKDPRTLAVLQSQALYGRPSSLASWLKYIDLNTEMDEDFKEFWFAYSGRFNDVMQALAKLELELAASREDVLAAFDLLRLEFQQSGAPSAVALARAILNENDGETNQEIDSLLRLSAQQGIGDAMQLLASLNKSEAQAYEVYQEYKEVIETNGDFDALVFAIPFLSPTDRERYFERAVSVIPCDYKNAMSLARVAFKSGMDSRANQWLTIASHLTNNNAWAQTDLAKAKLAYVGMSVADEAAELLRLAYAAGDNTASFQLFDLLINKDASTFAPDEAADMITKAVETEDYAAVSAYLGRYRRADADSQAYLEENLDMPQVYRLAANSGDIYAMRFFGLHLRKTAQQPSDLVASTDWLRRAAESGEVIAMAEYGQALAFGIGVDADLNEAKAWLAKAAERGNKKAISIMALVELSAEDQS